MKESANRLDYEELVTRNSIKINTSAAAKLTNLESYSYDIQA